MRHVGQEHALGPTRALDVVEQRPLVGAVTKDPHDTLEFALCVPQWRVAHADGYLLPVVANARHLARAVRLLGALDRVVRAILGVTEGASVGAQLAEDLVARLAVDRRRRHRQRT